MQIKNSDTLTSEVSKNETIDFSQLGQDHSKNGSIRTNRADFDSIICRFCDLPFVHLDKAGQLDWLRVHQNCGLSIGRKL